MKNFPSPVIVDDVTVSGLLAGSSKFRIIFAASKNKELFEYRRVDRNGDIINIAEISDIDKADAIRSIEQPCIYAGPIFLHFGHMAAEGIHRVWAAHFEHFKTYPVVFQTGSKERALPDWFLKLLSVYGIGPDRLVLISDATHFKTLVVPQQARLLTGLTTIENYVHAFPLVNVPFSSEDTGRYAGGLFYFSRSRHIHSGSYIGETAVQTILADNGFTIVYPEDLDIAVVSDIITQGSVLIFCEGSAIHNIEHCGRVSAKICIIGRRPGTSDRFKHLLDQYSDDYIVIDESSTIGSLHGDRDGITALRGKALSSVDIAGLITRISAFVGIDMAIPSPDSLIQSAAADLMKYVLNPKSYGPHTSDEHLGRMLRTLTANPHVKMLVDHLNAA